jgi:hypothetical protein
MDMATEDARLWAASRSTRDPEEERQEVGIAMKHILVWLAVPLLLIGAAMLIGGLGATALWIAVITVGIALVAIDGNRHRHERHPG